VVTAEEGRRSHRLMQTFLDALRWLVTGSHLHGPGGIPVRMLQHVELSLSSMAIASAIAIPVGLYVGHTRRFQFVSVSVANVGRAVPSFAILVLAYVVVSKVAPRLSFGFTPTVVALTVLAIPPILTNTYVGIQAVDPDTIEAARGVGMSERDVLLRLELPLATPLIMAGLRTAAVTVVATATLAALIAGGGLGRFIIDGFAQSDEPMLVAGAILVGVLSVLTEVTFGMLERTLSPRMRSSGRRRMEPAPAADVAPAA
jgi:osmoprotectant transport system permease protein